MEQRARRGEARLLAAKYDRVGGTTANVAGISRWLDKQPQNP
jgi:hypothetical protein